ncbi:MAG: TolC family protein, partial [Comamonas sp.]
MPQASRPAHRAATRAMPLLAALVLAGCASPAHHDARPTLDLPANWAQPAAAPATGSAAPDAPASPPWAASARWWERFGDPALNQLIDEALARNNDLASAALNVRQAQLEADLNNGDPLVYGAQAGLSADATRRLDTGRTSNSRASSASASVSYSIDLWGRLARQRDIAQWALQATEADRETVRLNIIGTTASLYWQLGYLNQRLRAAEQS